IERNTSTQVGTDSTIKLLNSVPLSTGKRGSAETVRAMHSVAEVTSGRTVASFCSPDIAVPRSGGGHCTLRSIATGTSKDAARIDLATSDARIIPLPRSQFSNSLANEKKQSPCRGLPVADRKCVLRA